jgi:proteasome lid subunit RPN8/RPN11
MTPLSGVTTVAVPRSSVDEIQAHLRRVGRDGYEGLGLLVGRQDGERFEVTQAVIPAQRHRRTSDGVCVIVEGPELHRLNVWLYRKKLTLVAQIHSHPGRAYHSDTDDAYAVATTVGCLSLVVPDFARRPFELRDVASYRLDAKARWKPLSRAEVARTITITD